MWAELRGFGKAEEMRLAEQPSDTTSSPPVMLSSIHRQQQWSPSPVWRMGRTLGNTEKDHYKDNMEDSVRYEGGGGGWRGGEIMATMTWSWDGGTGGRERFGGGIWVEWGRYNLNTFYLYKKLLKNLKLSNSRENNKAEKSNGERWDEVPEVISRRTMATGKSSMSKTHAGTH